jgi:enoyl-CoA hydratase
MLTVEEDGDVAVVRMEHGRVNALDLELLEALTSAVTGTDRALVLTGTGSAFSAGVDLRRILDGGPRYTEDFLAALSRMFRAVFDHPRPTVAAINGHAIAGGCVLALACDARLMSGGRIGLSELAVGVPFPVAALEIVRHALGPGADRAVLRAEVVDRDAARVLHLVDEVTWPDELGTDAVAVARELAARPADVYAAAKERLHRPAVAAMEAAAGDDDAVLAGWTSDAARGRIESALAALADRRAASGPAAE